MPACDEGTATARVPNWPSHGQDAGRRRGSSPTEGLRAGMRHLCERQEWCRLALGVASARARPQAGVGKHWERGCRMPNGAQMPRCRMWMQGIKIQMQQVISHLDLTNCPGGDYRLPMKMDGLAMTLWDLQLWRQQLILKLWEPWNLWHQSGNLRSTCPSQECCWREDNDSQKK